MLDAAEAHLQAGRFAEAIGAFRALLSANPDNGVLRGRVAEAYRIAGNVERAFHHFHKAATLCVRANDLTGAIRMLEAANGVSPNEPEVLFRWAECLEQLGRVEGLRPLLYQLIGVAGASGDRRRLWALDRLVVLEPSNLELAVARAAAMAEAGRIQESVAAWQALAATLGRCRLDWVGPISATARRAVGRPDYATILAQILLMNRRPRDALALLVPFYDEHPDDVDILQVVTGALEAMEAWDRVLAARLELLRAQVKRRLRSQALEAVAYLLRTYPTDAPVLQDCATACETFGLNGEASRLRYQLCQLHDRRGEAALRDQVLTQLLEADPRHEGALAMAAAVLQTAGRTTEARLLLERLDDVRAGDPSRGPVSASSLSVWTGAVQTADAPVADTAPLENDADDIGSWDGGMWADASAVSLSDADVLASRTDQSTWAAVGADEPFIERTMPPDAMPAGQEEATLSPRGLFIPNHQSRPGIPRRRSRAASMRMTAPASTGPRKSDEGTPWAIFEGNPTTQTPRQEARTFEEATAIERTLPRHPSLIRDLPPFGASHTENLEDTVIPEPDARNDFAEEPPTKIDLQTLSEDDLLPPSRRSRRGS